MLCVADDPTPPEAGQQQSVSPSAQPTPTPSIVGLREKAFLYVLLTGFLIGAHGASSDPTVKGSSSVSRRYHPAPKEALGRIEGQQYSRGLGTSAGENGRGRDRRFFQEIIKRPSLIV
jgi:hypothetical protein